MPGDIDPGRSGRARLALAGQRHRALIAKRVVRQNRVASKSALDSAYRDETRGPPPRLGDGVEFVCGDLLQQEQVRIRPWDQRASFEVGDQAGQIAASAVCI